MAQSQIPKKQISCESQSMSACDITVFRVDAAAGRALG